jgi:hypothetical protein
MERAQQYAPLIIANDPAIGKWSAVGVDRRRGGRHVGHVAIDEEQRKMAVRREESPISVSIIYQDGTSP